MSLKSIARRALIAGGAVVALAGLVAGGFAVHSKRVEALQQVPPPETFPWALRTALVAKRDLTVGFPVLARLGTQAEIAVIPQISGVIREMGPREGRAVTKGQLLVRLDTEEIANQIASLEASRDAAKDNVGLQIKQTRRADALLLKGDVTQEAVDIQHNLLKTARQQVETLSGQIDAARTRLGYGTIRSTVDGVISARLQEPGDLAAPGRTIYRITSTAGAEISVTVPQQIAARLKVGGEIRLEGLDGPLSVKISRVFPALDELSMGSAEADLETIPFGLPSGARVPARVVLERRPGALVVPRTALILSPDGATAQLFRINAGPRGGPDTLEAIDAKILASGHEGVALESGVDEDDTVAVAQETQLLRLRDGDPVVPEHARGE